MRYKINPSLQNHNGVIIVEGLKDYNAIKKAININVLKLIIIVILN